MQMHSKIFISLIAWIHKSTLRLVFARPFDLKSATGFICTTFPFLILTSLHKWGVSLLKNDKQHILSYTAVIPHKI